MVSSVTAGVKPVLPPAFIACASRLIATFADAEKPLSVDVVNTKIEFRTRWDEARRAREAAAEARRARRKPVAPGSEEFVARALDRKERVRRRLEEGFVHHGGDVAGRWRPAFREHGLRSDSAHNLQRLVQIAPRWHRMQVGRDKEIMHGTDAKLFGLDEPYIVLNSVVRSAFRIDLDLEFASWEALRYEIEQLPLPCLPHLSVGYEDETGRVERPHLIYLLPYGHGVWFSDDPRCRHDVMQFFRGVHAGITKTFLPLGADPGALSNPMRLKNPLSPFWRYRAWNDDIYPTLRDWHGWVDTCTDRRRMIRESAAALSKTGLKASNRLFDTFQGWVYDTLRDWHRSAEPTYMSLIARGDRDELAARLFGHLVGRASASAERPKQGQAILYRVADFAATRWDPRRCRPDRTRDRGAAGELVEHIAGTAARQAAGARWTHDLRRRRSADAVRAAIDAASAAGEAVNIASIARRTGLSRPTVRAAWPSC